MTKETLLESINLGETKQVKSIHDLDTIYFINKLITIKNKVHVQVQKVTDTDVELLNFPMAQFLSEFVVYIEPPEIEIEIMEAPIVEETPKKKTK